MIYPCTFFICFNELESYLWELQAPIFPYELMGCKGLPQCQWITKPIMLTNDIGQPNAKALCHSVDPILFIETNGPLGDD